MKIVQIKTKTNFDLFWSYCKPHLRAVLDNATFNPVNEEDYEYFLGGEYLTTITELFKRKQNKLRAVFFADNDENIVGFASYVIYHTEDAKCFLLEFNVQEAYRNQGLGTKLFSLLENHWRNEGAVYAQCNCSNEANKRFWLRNGFVVTNIIENNDPENIVYEKIL